MLLLIIIPYSVEGAFVSLRMLCKCFIIFIYLSMKKGLEKNNILL